MLPFSLGKPTVAQDEEALHDLTPLITLRASTPPVTFASGGDTTGKHSVPIDRNLSPFLLPSFFSDPCLQMTANLRYCSQHTLRYKHVFFQASGSVFNTRILLDDISF